MNEKKIIIIAGPTASGKTSFAINLAKEIDGIVINADSLQVYKENPIISAQPTAKERQDVPHFLFGYVMGDEKYDIARWIKNVCEIIAHSDKPIILVGGTGFYLKHLIFGLSSIPEIPDEDRDNFRTLAKEVGAINFHKLLKEVDPVSADKIEPNNIKKVLRAYEVLKITGYPLDYWQKNNLKYFPLSSFKMIILQPDREILYRNCNQRFLDMLGVGVLQEVKFLIDQNYNLETGIMKSHGVPELRNYLAGDWSLNQATEKSQQVVRNYAKRQTTWFKHQFNHPDLLSYVAENPNEEFCEILEQCKLFLRSV